MTEHTPYEALNDALDELDEPMPCGHPMWALEYDNDGNEYCAWCKSLEQALAAAQAYARMLESDIEPFDKLVYFGRKQPEKSHKAALDATLEQARAEERERAAKIAETAYRSQPFLAQPAAIVLGGYIAEAIRGVMTAVREVADD